MNSKRIYLSPPHMCGEELNRIHEAFSSNWIAPVGPHVDAFEKEFCTATGAPCAAAVSSGTAALHLALILAGIGTGDEVACSTFTFAGSAYPIRYVGATPVFIDSDENSWNMDPELFEKAAKERQKKGKGLKAVIVVHLYGQSADTDALLGICQRFNIVLIEDAAESLGALYKGKQTGTIGKIGIYSFNGNKIITTSGGGMLVSAEKTIVDKARFYATQARDPAPYYQHSHIGYNYRMSNICAAIGRGQLTVLGERVKRKREIYTIYNKELSAIPGVSFMPEADFGTGNRWLSCFTIDQNISAVTPEELRVGLEKENIESRPLWKPMHLQPVFSSCPSYISGVSEKIFLQGLCLPSGTNMTQDELQKVIQNVNKIFHGKSY